jgi:aspartate aminotransferase-like enzyme
MEFSVVFTDRSLNHMSKAFQGVMNDLYAMLREVYHADAAVIVPGGGTFAMEAVARQFATDNKVMVIRNGWFSYRWTQIFEMGDIPSETTVIKASQVGNETTSAFAPEADRRDRRPDPRGAAGRRFRAACGNLRRRHPAR